jgi:hypothetical protein
MCLITTRSERVLKKDELKSEDIRDKLGARSIMQTAMKHAWNWKLQKEGIQDEGMPMQIIKHKPKREPCDVTENDG